MLAVAAYSWSLKLHDLVAMLVLTSTDISEISRCWCMAKPRLTCHTVCACVLMAHV